MWRFNKQNSIYNAITYISRSRELTNEMIVDIYIKAVLDEGTITRSLLKDMDQALTSLKNGQINRLAYPIQQQLFAGSDRTSKDFQR